MEEAIRRRLEIGFGLVMLAVFVVFLVVGLAYPPRPRELPLLVDIAGIVIMTLHLAKVIRKPAAPGKKSGAPVNWRAVYLAFGSMVLYLILSYFIGMVLSSAVIVYICGIAFGAKSKVKVAVVSVLTVAAVYLLFVQALGVRLYGGILFGG